MVLFQCAYLAKKLYALSYDDMIKDTRKKDVISKLIGEDFLTKSGSSDLSSDIVGLECLCFQVATLS